MRKARKIILLTFAVLVIALGSFLALVFLDATAYTATGSQTLNPPGASVGKAIVIYDPGFTGAVKGFAGKVATDLQSLNYTVTLAGVKSSAATKTSNCAVIVVGGPIYGGSPTASVKATVSKLSLPSGTKLGVFGTGWIPQSKDDDAIRSALKVPTDTVVAKINLNGDTNANARDFVNQLLK
jgi:hypothetical protein